ncbi:MAG TPA: glycosyltransferase family 4 protein [Ktedonobacterales bacterium]
MKQHEPSPLIDLAAASAPEQAQTARQQQPRALLVISAEVRQAVLPEIAAGRYPRKDYFELARALRADILDLTAIDARSGVGLLARVAGKSVAPAWLAFRQRRSYQVIYTDSERVGIPLTLLLRLARARCQHVMLAHLLSPWKKRVWFRWGRLHAHIAAIICHSSLQRQVMIEKLRIPAEKIRLIPYQVDERFWQPMSRQEAQAALSEAAAPTTAGDGPANSPASETTSAPATPIICSVGLEYRDYPTLIEAVRGVDMQLEIAAASHWSTHRGIAANQSLPPNVHISAHQYLSLRHLYASSRFVVVPLLDVPNQAGITTILEAMAMGKAVVVSGTRGQTDTVRDRRNNGFGRIEREVLPGFLDAPDVAEELRHLATGFYVRPGDAAELRAAIAYLLAHPDVADELGRNGRRVFTALMTLDAFTARVAEIVQAAGE